MNWQSFAPYDTSNDAHWLVHWVWNKKAKKWVRIEDHNMWKLYWGDSLGGRMLYSRQQAALNIANSYYKKHSDILSKTTSIYNTKDQRIKKKYMKLYNANQDLVKAFNDKYANPYMKYKKHVLSDNQEANAWLHENYGDSHYYTTNVLKAEPYEKYLENQSDDQLKKSQKFWQNQLHHFDKHGSKNKQDWWYDGDADNAHYAQNYGPHNPVYDMIHARLTPLIPKWDAHGHHFWNQIDPLAKNFNDNLYNLESLRAKLAESTKHDNNYYKILREYNLLKTNTKNSKKAFSAYAKNFGGMPGYILRNFFKYYGNSLYKRYYLDNSYLNHDNLRLFQVEQYMKIRHQQEIDASIRVQVANNTDNHLTSIYRKDHKTDTVIGFAELQPEESMDMNLESKPVDKGMPQTNYAQINSFQLSTQGDLYNRPLVFNPLGDDSKAHQQTRWQEYNILRTWMKTSTPLIVNGFNHWGSTLIQSISKSPDQNGTDNALTIQMTIQYIRLAKIVWGKKSKTAASKGRHTNKRGGSKYRVKPGDNMWTIAKRHHVGLNSLIKANRSVVHNHPSLIYPKQKLVIPNE